MYIYLYLEKMQSRLISLKSPFKGLSKGFKRIIQKTGRGSGIIRYREVGEMWTSSYFFLVLELGFFFLLLLTARICSICTLQGRVESYVINLFLPSPSSSSFSLHNPQLCCANNFFPNHHHLPLTTTTLLYLCYGLPKNI